GYLSEADAERWKQEPLPTERKGMVVGVNAPYFVEWVRNVLDDRFGPRLYSGGLRVHTTLDLDMQRVAREAMEEGWARLEAAGARGPKYADVMAEGGTQGSETQDRKSTRLNSSHVKISYAVFCLKKKTKKA